MQLSEEQGQAVAAVTAWWKTKRQVFELSGAAGTGKTTLAKFIVGELGLAENEVCYCAFTGKAALVLSQKGCNPASTVHSLIYKAYQNELTGRWSYSLSTEKVREMGVKLVVLDEAPMLGARIAQDLLECNVRVLALGDKHQLPPVKDEAYFGVAEPDFLLTEVHRQAKDNPIIALATLVRNGGTLQIGNYGSSKVMSAKRLSHEMLLEPDQVLCGKNDTRHYLNHSYRVAAELAEELYPLDGERLICLRNNHDRGFLNGQMFMVSESEFDGNDVQCQVVPVDFPDQLPVKISTPVEYFRGQERFLDWRVRKNCDEFAFGYAISVHKSQGSQWANVLILDQSKAFKEDASKHLYTAITRASDSVTVLI